MGATPTLSQRWVEVLLRCSTCAKWLLRKETSYGNGETIVNWSDPDGKGQCSFLNINTVPDFGCNQYEVGGPIIEKHFKEGEPWHYWRLDKCPECHGLGTGGPSGRVDNRCCGTGLVMYFDDGYIGDNMTKMHPKEKVKRPDPVFSCFNCHKPADAAWIACPYCGTNLKEAKPEPASALVA